MIKKFKQSIVLLSGGIDSAACLNYYLEAEFEVRCVHINFGQQTFRTEGECAKAIANHYNVPIDMIHVNFEKIFLNGEIAGRNGAFLLLTLMKYPDFNGLVSLGIHDEVNYFDTKPNFVHCMQEIINSYTRGNVRLDVPFLNWNKRMVYDYAKTNGIPIELTYSCEVKESKPCGKCPSCLDREALDEFSTIA